MNNPGEERCVEIHSNYHGKCFTRQKSNGLHLDLQILILLLKICTNVIAVIDILDLYLMNRSNEGLLVFYCSMVFEGNIN